MNARSIGRRRFLKISAAAIGAAAIPALAAAPSAHRHVREGVLLGADTAIQLYHHDAAAARAAIDACFAEVARLEAIFSLHRPDSALSRLNSDARIDDAPRELARLLETAAAFSRASDGAFDVTVQPLWSLYSRHFAAADADPDGPPPHRIAQALARIDYREVRIVEDTIRFARPGMAVTLNGIAQGFITDCVTGMLRARGFDNVLVDMGEFRALGNLPDGAPWRVGIADPQQPWRPLAAVALRECAIATSGGYGTAFDASGRHHHLFDPRSGRSAHNYRSVSVIAPDATTADALSTALSMLAPEAAIAMLGKFAGSGALFIDADGRRWTAGSDLAF